MNTRKTTPDYYDILKIPVWAETDEIRTSYKRLALAHHPDKDPNNPNATAFFQSIQAAHSTLTDPVKRSAYDRDLYMGLDIALHRFREKKKAIKEDLRINIQNEVARHRVIEYEKRMESPSCPSARRVKHEAASKKLKDVIIMQENQLASLKAEINKMKITMNAMLARGYKPIVYSKTRARLRANLTSYQQYKPQDQPSVIRFIGQYRDLPSYPALQPAGISIAPYLDIYIMEENRTIASNTFGNENYIIQGNVNYNHYAGSHAETSPGQVDNVLKCLYKSPYKDRKDRNPQRVQGTCDWFASHEHFRTWNESSSLSLLWVSADPGCGKSVLARHLVDSVLQTTASRTVCYFFFKDDFPDQKNVASALCCILRQIFVQKPTLLSEAILKRFNTGGETFNASFSELWQTFLQVAEDENAGEIVCLLDAIDECEEQNDQGRSQLLKALCALYGTKRSFNIKFLITSRPYVEIHRGLQPLDIPGLPVIHLSGESEDEMKKISQEINVYIGARVQDIGQRLQLTQNECSVLLQRLMRVPNRTYLWVYLTLDLIESSINITEKIILEVTSNIPTTIDEAYERILSRSSNTRQARIIFHIIVAAARPLTVKEMNFALASSETRQPHPDMELVPDDRFRENLRNICGLCIMIVDSKIYLLHQTVKEFLVKGNMTHISQSESDGYEWKYSIQPQESHIILAKICIWHLLAGSQLSHESRSWHAWRDTFLDYSAKYWLSHFREMDSEAQSMLTKSILTICDVNSLCCKTWFAVHWSTMQTERPQGFTTIIMASYFGLDFVVQCLLNTDVDLNAQDETYQRSALCWAVRNGFRMVAELLISGSRIKLRNFKLPLRKGAKIDLQDKYGRTPLTYAIWNGDGVLVKLLMKAGANEHLKDRLKKTPLFYAICNSDHEIIDLFVKKKRPVDVQNDIKTLLFSAIDNKHEEVVMQLLKTGRANLEAWNTGGETVLTYALRVSNKSIVKMLLDAGANPNEKDFGHDEPALFTAICYQGEAVKLLLEAGADANGGERRTALMYASERGVQTAVEALLAAGADSNARSHRGLTALMHASVGGHEAIVKLLLDARADINAQSNEGTSALLYASIVGHERIVKLLLEAGADAKSRADPDALALLYASVNDHSHNLAAVKLLYARVDTSPQTFMRYYGELSHRNFRRGAHKTIAKLLLEAGAYGANSKIRDDILAFSEGHQSSMLGYLREAGADSDTIQRVAYYPSRGR